MFDSEKETKRQGIPLFLCADKMDTAGMSSVKISVSRMDLRCDIF